jgi:pimeloyl-ACP methyl ester carboxylesterase
MVTLRHGYTDARFGQLHFLEGRPVQATRRTLVLLHQNPSSSEEYRHLVARMAIDRRVVAFDTPGHGMSDRPESPLPIRDYAAAFAEGMATMGLDEPVDLFGFHTGTFLAVELAALLGEQVRHIALSGVPFRSPEERRERLEQCRAVQPPTDDGEAIFTRLRWLWDFTVAQRVPGMPIERAAQIWAERAKPLHRYGWLYDGVWSYPVEERLAAIAHPVLIVQPHEPLLEHSVAAAALIPDARVVELPGMARDIFEPAGGVDRIAQALRDFFDQQDPIHAA